MGTGEDASGSELERNCAGEDSDGGDFAMGDDAAELMLQPQRPRTRLEGARRVEDQNREANWIKGCISSLFAVITAVFVAARAVGASAGLACAGADAGSDAACFKCGACLSERMSTHRISCEECNTMMCEVCDRREHINLHGHSRSLHSVMAGRCGLDAEDFLIDGAVQRDMIVWTENEHATALEILRSLGYKSLAPVTVVLSAALLRTWLAASDDESMCGVDTLVHNLEHISRVKGRPHRLDVNLVR
ncbi:hypothetical protein T492DRAFT_1126830 [Pavlovales sp. CCMP2436]|nr:hypothetical protein T492DRAFT_1126830 [Pavlovales sp. CCMP2436]